MNSSSRPKGRDLRAVRSNPKTVGLNFELWDCLVTLTHIQHFVLAMTLKN